MKLTASSVALSHDVWETIKNTLNLEKEYILQAELWFFYGEATLYLQESGGKRTTSLMSDERVGELCEVLESKFNLPVFQCEKFKVELYPDQLPIFKMDVIPFVNDPKELMKPRVSQATIDRKSISEVSLHIDKLHAERR